MVQSVPGRLNWEERKAGGFDLRLFLDPKEVVYLLFKLSLPAVFWAWAADIVLDPLTPAATGTTGVELLLTNIGGVLFTAATGLLLLIIVAHEYVEPLEAPGDLAFDNRYAVEPLYPWPVTNFTKVVYAPVVLCLVAILAWPLPDVVLAMLRPTIDLGIGLWAVAKFLAGYVVSFVATVVTLMLAWAGVSGGIGL